MSTRIAINGFGRIGRGFVRAAIESDADLEIVAVNDVADAGTLAHLLAPRLDLRPLPRPVRVRGRHPARRRPAHRGRRDGDPEDLPWDDLEVDVVIESTGQVPHARRRRPPHGRRREQGDPVRPDQGLEPADADIVLGVNDDVYDLERHHIITNASCTTNCLAPVAGVLHGTVGIRHGLMTTIHAYTADQNLLDAPHKDLRRARAGGDQPRPDVDRRRKGARARHPRARRAA